MSLVLTPAGHLVVTSAHDALEDDSASVLYRSGELEQAFAGSLAAGIMALAGGKTAQDWPLAWHFWRDLGIRYLLLLCQTQPRVERLEPLPPPDAATLAYLTLSLPPMPGAECQTPRFFGRQHFVMGKKGQRCYWNTGTYSVNTAKGMGDDTLMRACPV